ncbi:hypothetical protein Patl1_22189 [Pistacia atlantica]|uniref:Uncharacterized protein n=1 Tax=Pistacia atlantica TaxID=434234 RepID=A0ACC1BJP5_9ROSI|nr:hypothetical protein Patl1_22189 [Pistacia atlantica]
MLPNNFGKKEEYAGAAIWGSSPSIDPIGNHVYIATGNLYSAPLRLEMKKGSTQTLPAANTKPYTLRPSKSTTIAGGWVAMDAKNGSVLWSTTNLSNAMTPGPVTAANGVLFGGSC